MPDYEKQWQIYKRRRNRGLFLLIGYIPITFAFGFITVRAFHTETPVFVFSVLWMLLGGYVATHDVIACPRCPKCGKPFCLDGDQSKYR